jgi:hypothetical protein
MKEVEFVFNNKPYSKTVVRVRHSIEIFTDIRDLIEKGLLEDLSIF